MKRFILILLTVAVLFGQSSIIYANNTSGQTVYQRDAYKCDANSRGEIPFGFKVAPDDESHLRMSQAFNPWSSWNMGPITEEGIYQLELKYRTYEENDSVTRLTAYVNDELIGSTYRVQRGQWNTEYTDILGTVDLAQGATPVVKVVADRGTLDLTMVTLRKVDVAIISHEAENITGASSGLTAEADGSRTVLKFEGGTYAEYKINAAAPGYYKIKLLLSSEQGSGTLAVAAAAAYPKNYKTSGSFELLTGATTEERYNMYYMDGNVYLKAGENTLKIESKDNAFILDSFSLEYDKQASISLPSEPNCIIDYEKNTSSMYGRPNLTDWAGYHSDPILNPISSDGTHLRLWANYANQSWAEYTFTVPATGTYMLNLRWRDYGDNGVNQIKAQVDDFAPMYAYRTPDEVASLTNNFYAQHSATPGTIELEADTRYVLRITMEKGFIEFHSLWFALCDVPSIQCTAQETPVSISEGLSSTVDSSHTIVSLDTSSNVYYNVTAAREGLYNVKLLYSGPSDGGYAAPVAAANGTQASAVLPLLGTSVQYVNDSGVIMTDTVNYASSDHRYTQNYLTGQIYLKSGDNIVKLSNNSNTLYFDRLTLEYTDKGNAAVKLPELYKDSVAYSNEVIGAAGAGSYIAVADTWGATGDSPLTLIAGVYDGDGLVNAYIQTGAATSEVPVSVGFDIPDDGTAYNVKLFVFDGLSSLRPLTKNVIYN